MTVDLALTLAQAWSPLTEGRGLKYMGAHRITAKEAVAPHGGAWIEISSSAMSKAE